jgi:hypothetical protein
MFFSISDFMFETFLILISQCTLIKVLCKTVKMLRKK